MSSYYKNDTVLNCAISGLCDALWDIKGRQAGMPVYQLVGGKCREAADIYLHVNLGAQDPGKQLVENSMKLVAKGAVTCWSPCFNASAGQQPVRPPRVRRRLARVRSRQGDPQDARRVRDLQEGDAGRRSAWASTCTRCWIPSAACNSARTSSLPAVLLRGPVLPRGGRPLQACCASSAPRRWRSASCGTTRTNGSRWWRNVRSTTSAITSRTSAASPPRARSPRSPRTTK